MNAIPVTHSLLIRYGVIAVPLAFAGFPLYVLAPDFYATHHGVSLGALGLILLAIRLWDAVQDPIIGWLTDKSVGRFMPIVSGSALCLCVSVGMLFNVLIFSPAVWFALCMFFAITSYSVISIVLGAQATLWTENKDDQTRLAVVRESFGLFGLVVAVSMPAVLQKIVPEGQVYLWYSAILAVFVAIGLVSFSKIARMKMPVFSTSVARTPFFAAWSMSSRTVRLFFVYAISLLASSIPAVLVIFFVRDFLGAGDLIGFFLFLYFASGIAAMPVWKKISVRFGKYAAWAIANILAVAGFIGAFFLGYGDVTAYALVCLVSGLALGADLTLPPSILASQIHVDKNQQFSGTYYAFLAFIAKSCLALASVIALPYLDYVGFVPQADNSPDALRALSVAYALIPCVLKLSAAALLFYFFITPFSGGNDETVKSNSHYRSSYHA